MQPARPAAGCQRVYTVAPGRPFLAGLARALAAGDLPARGGTPPDPLQLADTTLYLPTRRATRALQEAFLEVSGGGAVLLPSIKPIAEGSEDLDLIASVEDHAGGDAGTPGAISDLQRRLVLTALVMRWAAADRRDKRSVGDPVHSAGARTPAQAAKLAKELASLIDMLERENIDAGRLSTLVPEEHSEHWAGTLAFLRIVTEFWPKHLKENNLTSAVARRQRLMRAEVERLRTAPPVAPVIVAGVTAADPIAIELMRAVMDQPNGALVLPALDRTLDDQSWALIDEHPEHPQFGLKRLMDGLGVSRADVQLLDRAEAAAPARARWSLACEAMRPAATTERWQPFAAAAAKEAMAAALVGVSAVEAATAEDEAEAVALMLREALETPGRTARLVTPDRTLARRVAARLEAWGIMVEPAAGLPFRQTLPGTLLDLVAAAVEKDFAPVALMSLLKHPLCRAAMPAGDMRRATAALELAAFRSPYFGKGLGGVEAALEGAQSRSWRHAAVRRLEQADWRAARELLRRLAAAFGPMQDAFASTKPAKVHDLARLHYATAQALARTSDDDDGSALRQGDAGEWAAQFFASLIDGSMPAPEVAPADYPDFYRTLVADKTIRSRRQGHPRITICDPVEARLQQSDVVILGSLNEGTWPEAADPGPWLSRPMRASLGLPAPEERIGSAAHDFVSQLGAGCVILTRAAKVDGAPTVPSRWLLRLQALVGGLGLELKPEQPWLAWARARNAIDGPVQSVRAPEPRPPVARRPRMLSVTAIETWIANPYAVFAKTILGLDPLPLLGERPGPALRGQIVHEALNKFAHRFPEKLPADIAGELMAISESVLAGYTGNPRVAALWAQRLGRFAMWFAETEAARRAGTVKTLPEVEGRMVLAGPAGPFTLTARADRIDIGDGLTITDYKSGQNLQPLAGKALAGQAPQLPLEAAIAAAHGFAGVPPGRVTQLGYISTSGGEPPGQDVPLKAEDVAQLARSAQEGLERLIAQFDREETPYRAVRRARFKYDYDQYAHLARVAEWLVANEEED
jgi:ATP-dependent helicase/nuclease subunit B